MDGKLCLGDWNGIRNLGCQSILVVAIHLLRPVGYYMDVASALADIELYTHAFAGAHLISFTLQLMQDGKVTDKSLQPRRSKSPSGLQT